MIGSIEELRNMDLPIYNVDRTIPDFLVERDKQYNFAYNTPCVKGMETSRFYKVSLDGKPHHPAKTYLEVRSWKFTILNLSQRPNIKNYNGSSTWVQILLYDSLVWDTIPEYSVDSAIVDLWVVSSLLKIEPEHSLNTCDNRPMAQLSRSFVFGQGDTNTLCLEMTPLPGLIEDVSRDYEYYFVYGKSIPTFLKDSANRTFSHEALPELKNYSYLRAMHGVMHKRDA